MVGLDFLKGIVNFICVRLVIIFWMARIRSGLAQGMFLLHLVFSFSLKDVYEPLFGFLNNFSPYP